MPWKKRLHAQKNCHALSRFCPKEILESSRVQKLKSTRRKEKDEKDDDTKWGGMAQGNVLHNCIKWCNERLQRDVTRVTEIDTSNQEKLIVAYMCLRTYIHISVCPIKNLTKLRSGASLDRIMKFSSIWCHFCNNVFFLEMKINLLFNATIRSLSSGNRQSFPRESDNGNKRFPRLPVSWGKRKKTIRDMLRKKVQRGQLMPSFFFEHSTAFSRVSLKYPQKKSLTRETRISVLTTVEKNKKSRFNFSYLVFYLVWDCDVKHNKLSRFCLLLTCDIYPLTR